MSRLRIYDWSWIWLLACLSSILVYNYLIMNELDAIQAQMANLGVDVSAPEQMPQQDFVPSYDVENPELTEADIAMLSAPAEEEVPMYDMDELKIDIGPMLQWLPKDELADLIIWISEQWSILNESDEE